MSGLIKKKRPLMQPPAPVKKTQEDAFAYTEPTEKAVPKAKPTKKSKNSIGKRNSTKSIKVPTTIHTELNLLGSFMDENKTYAILQKLIDSYVKNELTERQQRQLEFMVEAFKDEE